jgi:Delta7-sterol 5-desaturase
VKAKKRAVAAAMLMLAANRPASADDGVIDRWLTPGASAVVELARCASAATLCGTIRWLWQATDDKGRQRLDSQNSDPSLRARPLLGLVILSGLTRRPGGGWEGRIYNPEDGQTYRATISRRGADSLVVEGCVLFVCQKQIWRKASALAEALK